MTALTGGGQQPDELAGDCGRAQLYALVRAFRIMDPKVKNPQSEQWDRCIRLFHELRIGDRRRRIGKWRAGQHGGAAGLTRPTATSSSRS